MYVFQVPKMSCGGCANTITHALRQVDADAIIEIDLPDRTVSVESEKPESELAAAMGNAGYPVA